MVYIKNMTTKGSGKVVINENHHDQPKPRPKSITTDKNKTTPECIVAIDIIRSTEIGVMYGDQFYRDRFVELITLIKTLKAHFPHTQVKDLGDGFFLAFTQCQTGVEAMVELLRQQKERNKSTAPSHHMHLRIGIHYGPTLRKKEDPNDRSGLTLNMATRIESIQASDFSTPIQPLPLENRLLISYSVFRKLNTSIHATKLGMATLKGFTGQMHEIYSIQWDS